MQKDGKCGKLIVLEGIDGSGKATQAKLLVKRLKSLGFKAKVIPFPQYTKESSSLIREYLAGKFGKAEEVGPYRGSVFYAIDRYAASFEINRLLNKGYWIICDRYVSSNKGHQLSQIKGKTERKAFLSWINEFEYKLMGIPIPDQTIYLHLPYKIAYENIVTRRAKTGAKKDLLDKIKCLKSSEQAYLEVTKMDTFEKWHVVECSKKGTILSRESISEIVFNTINSNFLPSCSQK